jgi:hypothetical protein
MSGWLPGDSWDEVLMAEIIAFRPRVVEQDEADVDLLTAVDAAIRDLRDISQGCLEEGIRHRANECRTMLERAYRATVD